jgi:hypothetical protein
MSHPHAVQHVDVVTIHLTLASAALTLIVALVWVI